MLLVIVKDWIITLEINLMILIMNIMLLNLIIFGILLMLLGDRDISLMILLYLSKTIFSYTLFEAFEGYWLLKVVIWGNL